MKRFISCIVVVLMITSILPMSVFAQELNQPKLSIDSTQASPGEVFDVNVTLENNPGIVSANIKIDFDEGLTLVGATNGDAFSTLTYIPPKQLSSTGRITSSCQFAWSGFDIADEDIKDGTILTLSFEMSEEAEIGDSFNITISNNAGDVIDKNLNQFSLSAESVITAVDYTPCDVNDDGSINMLDVVLLSRYIVDGCKYDPDGYAVNINEKAGDFNGDGSLNMLDVVLTSRYIVDGCEYVPAPDGYGVKPIVPDKICVHTLQATEEKEATCTEEGNIAYWQCIKCKKYFADENANSQITAEDVVVQSQGHNNIYYEATDEYSAGTYCDRCDTWTSGHEKIEVNESSISYRYYLQRENNVGALEIVPDDYLTSHPINNPNPSTYVEGKGVEELYQGYEIDGKKVSANGYTFVGWFERPEIGANRVYSISTSEKGNKILYGIWTKNTYKIQYVSNEVAVTQDDTNPFSYVVDQEKLLPVLKHDGYKFIGWSDDEGNVITKIPSGTTGDKIYTANWLSNRNVAVTNKVLDKPIVYEDDNYILFTYEIGQINNVPLFELHDFGSLNGSGVSKEETITYKTTQSKDFVEEYSSYVSKATTESFGWTLSNEWSESLSIDKDWAIENYTSVEEAEEKCRNESNEWYVSSGNSGTDTTLTLNTTDGHNLTTTTNNTKTYDTTDKTDRQDFSAELNAEIKQTSGVKVGVPGVGDAEAGYEVSVGGSLKYSNGTTTNKKTGTEKDEGSQGQTGDITHGGTETTNSTTWNNESGTSGSQSISESETISKAVSETLSESTHYGKNYIGTTGDEKTQGFNSHTESSDEYSSAVTYSTIVEEERTETFKTDNAISGWHRWIMVGTAHVFAIVGYDVANESYFVTNYTIMDDTMKRYEDYAFPDSDGSYTDHQTSIITFNAPNEIVDYVLERTLATDGLVVNEQGIVIEYNGDGETVIIPEYYCYRYTDGHVMPVKVVGLSSEAFANNTKIVAVELSDYIDEVPNGAFANCTNLMSVEGKSLKKIGSRAFENCENLNCASISETITEIGEHAFDGIDDLYVSTGEPSVVVNALTSDVDNITIKMLYDCYCEENTRFYIPNTIDTVVFKGEGNIFENITIESDAQKTKIHRATFNSTEKTPLIISSPDITLEKVVVTSPGISLICSNENASLHLSAASNVSSSSENSMLCKNLSVDKVSSDAKMVVEKTLLTCGEITDENNLLEYETKKSISADEFEDYSKGVVEIVFNANGGTVDKTSSTVFYGQKYGELPVPTREHYSFLGWFTEAEGGTEITSESMVETLANQTLYAHWSRNTYKVNFNANGGSVSTANKNVESGATYGSLPTPTRTGWTFKGWFTATSGGSQVTANTTVALSGEQTLYARWEVNSYTVTWSGVSNCSITVKRTSSPNKGAATGNLSSGAPVYYGDVLSVTYSASTGYSIASKGATSITVTRNITKSDIYATVSANSYKYTVKYQSVNGTDLGSSSATYKFGTTNKITAPAKTGYETPSAQTIKWDATSKTITFKYKPISVATEQQMASGPWSSGFASGTGPSYVAYAQWQNRTATSVQVRIRWVQSIYKAWYGNNQYFSSTIGGVGTGTVHVVAASKWNAYITSDSVTAYSSWVTVPVSATATSVSISTSMWAEDWSGSWSKTMTIPTY